MQLTAAQKESFAKNGYVLFDGFIRPEELAEFKDTLTSLIRYGLKKASARFPHLAPEKFAGQELQAGMLALEKADHMYVADIYDALAYSTNFLRLVSKRETSQAVNLLMGRPQEEPLYTYTCRTLFIMPSDLSRTYGWHQEVFASVPESTFLQTWAPLIEDSSVANGTISVLPGSHLEGIAKQTRDVSPNRVRQYPLAPEVLARYKPVTMELKLGQMLIFDYRLIHRSGTNDSGKIRYSLVGMYHDTGRESFYAPSVSLNYRKKNPDEYFDEIFGEKAR